MTLDPFVRPPSRRYAQMSFRSQNAMLRLVKVFLEKCGSFRTTINKQGLYGDGAEEYVIKLLDEGYLKFYTGVDPVGKGELILSASLYNAKTKTYRTLQFDKA